MADTHGPSETINREKRKLRKAQAREVMPIIGPLLDAYEGLSNDFLSTLEDEAPEFVGYIEAINDAMENAE